MHFTYGDQHVYDNDMIHERPSHTTLANRQGFWQSARVRSRTIDQKSHYFALVAFSRTFRVYLLKKTHKLQN